ncbi:MAG: hypothetical protein ABII64_02480 [Elusimicrobiota bacterium]
MNDERCFSRKSVLQVIRDNKLLNKEEEEILLKECERTHTPIQTLAVRMQLIGKVDLLRAMSQDWNMKAVLLDGIEPLKEVVKLIPEEFARKHLIVPFVKDEESGAERLCVAISDYRDLSYIPYVLTYVNCHVETYLALPSDILQVLNKAYRNYK